MKTAFIIVGLDIHETAAGLMYKNLCSAVSKCGYRVIPVEISWRQTLPSQFAQQFINVFNKNKDVEQNVVIGNSFGAVAAFITAAEIKPEKLLLCSLSPFFKEDWDLGKPSKQAYRYLGKKRLEDIKGYSAEQVASEINKTDVLVKVLYGEKEHKTSPKLVKRCQETAKQLNKAQLIEIEKAPHSFHDENYIRGIVSVLQ